jgi:hypothetical protein
MGKGIFLNEKAAASNSKSLKEHDADKRREDGTEDLE